MSLPRGYTELEWIKSSGTQYIDTGYKAKSENYRIKCKFCFDTLVNNTAPFGGGSSTDIISALLRNNLVSYDVRFYVGSGRISGTDVRVEKGVNYELECWANNGNFTVILNGASYSGEYSGAINKEYSLAIFGNNVSGSVGQRTRIRISAFQIYDNGTLVRDFVPCLSPSNEAGFYDTVNGAFYPNLGTGTFETGAVVITTPSAPEYFRASGNGGTVQLNWAVDENTLGCLLYRNRELIADTSETSYTDTKMEIYSVQQYTLIPYNDAGNGPSVSLNIFIKGDPRPLGDLITDRTAADVTMRTKKGSYNASDMNRVLVAAEYVRQLIRALGYTLPDGNNRYMSEDDIPDTALTAAYLEDISGIDVIGYSQNKLILPVTLSHLTYEGANTIEKFLKMVGEAAERIPEAYIYSDEIYGGENY